MGLSPTASDLEPTGLVAQNPATARAGALSPTATNLFSKGMKK